MQEKIFDMNVSTPILRKVMIKATLDLQFELQELDVLLDKESCKLRELKQKMMIFAEYKVLLALDQDIIYI
jgi:hypothetical protein